MPYILTVALLIFSFSSHAVDGYNDIYLDREKPIYIHSIHCGTNFKKLSKLRPSYIYTNSANIEKGTYYFRSAHGDFSYTFKPIAGKNPTQIMARGLLNNAETSKLKMKKEVCIVGPITGLPNALTKKLGKKIIYANDPEWDLILEKYKIFGKPAFAKGVYKDQRSTAKDELHDKKIFAANQAYIKKMEQIFSQKMEQLANKLPTKMQAAVQYAHQEDGFLSTKSYPKIKQPLVWTPVAKERYDDQQRIRYQKQQWDIITQKNFDWLFNLVGKENDFKQSQILPFVAPKWVGQVLEQKVTVETEFMDGKKLLLDFKLSSSKVNATVFDSLKKIRAQSALIRNNPIASSKKPMQPIALPQNSRLTVYMNTEKVNIFFSPFRDKVIGENFRLE